MGEKLSKEELLKEHQSIIPYLKPYHYIVIPEGFLPSDAIFTDIETIHETQIDKEKLSKIIDKLAKGRMFQMGEDELNNINFAVCKCLDDLKTKLGLGNNNLIAGEDIKIGNLVTISSKNGKVYLAKIGDENIQPIGVFLRDIKKGEMLEYIPNGNTKDIATNSANG